MKTKGLTFTEAVLALKEKKCKGIRLPTWYEYEYLMVCGDSIIWNKWNNSISLKLHFDNYLCSDWELVDPVPETVTVELWVNVYRRLDGVHFAGSTAYASKELAEEWGAGGTRYCGATKITHTYEVPSNG